MSDFVKWDPQTHGHKPPYWREGMGWNLWPNPTLGGQYTDPGWTVYVPYSVPREAVYGPVEEAEVDQSRAASDFYLSDAARSLRQYSGKPQTKSRYASLSDLKQALSEHSAEELAKHGITLAPEKDWATELWVDALVALSLPEYADMIRKGDIPAGHKAAIELLRSRVVPKEASDA